MQAKKNAWPWLFVSLFVVIADQVTKQMVLGHLHYGEPVKVLPFLNLTLRFNTGAAFSFLGNQGGWQVFLFAAISVVVSIALVFWIARLSRNNWLIALPLSLILGGAVGNLIDRIRLGYVVDFFDFHVNGWHFATFNVADAAVSVGAALLILRMIYESVTG